MHKGMKYKHKEGKTKIGETEFVEAQYEEGVEKMIGKSQPTSLWRVHKAGRK